MTYMKKNLQFKKNALRTDRRTDGPTDRPTDRRTDEPSYRDARTHLKIEESDGIQMITKTLIVGVLYGPCRAIGDSGGLNEHTRTLQSLDHNNQKADESITDRRTDVPTDATDGHDFFIEM